MPRVFIIVMDGVGVGAQPDAAAFGDEGAATLQSIARVCGGLKLPNLERLGLGKLVQIPDILPRNSPNSSASRLLSRSAGKDSIAGHWELAGLVLDEPHATYPDGFPAEIAEIVAEIFTAPVLCNKAMSGTDVIDQFGADNLATARPILYTSSDSVLQVAMHEGAMAAKDLHERCARLRSAINQHNIGRVIARPFSGNSRKGFKRTSQRLDFTMPPPGETLLDRVKEAGLGVHGIGKISDLFAGRGLTTSVKTSGNADGMEQTCRAVCGAGAGLVITNLVDFDMLYGHRNDAQGFARALQEFDRLLADTLHILRPGDLLMITADHGCDPTFPGTDHTREYVPLLLHMVDAPAPFVPRTADLSVVARIAAEHLGLSGS